MVIKIHNLHKNDIQDLIRNIGRYATCFGLLRMPKLEELKYKTIEHFTDSDYDIREGIKSWWSLL